MKTLNKILRPIIAGSLIIGGCEENKKTKIEQISELERYNQENKKSYEDYIKFIKQNGKGNKEFRDFFIFVNSKIEVSSILDRNMISLYNGGTKENFYDFYLDGMNEMTDFYKKENGEIEYIEDMPKEKQLLVAKDYTESLKQIMRDARYKDY